MAEQQSSEQIFTAEVVEQARQSTPINEPARSEYEIFLNSNFPRLRLLAGSYTSSLAQYNHSPDIFVKGAVIGVGIVRRAAEITELAMPSEDGFEYGREVTREKSKAIHEYVETRLDPDASRLDPVWAMTFVPELRREQPAFYAAGLLIAGRVVSAPVSSFKSYVENNRSFVDELIQQVDSGHIGDITIDMRPIERALNFLNGYSISVLGLTDLFELDKILGLEP